jgi:Ca-activated chloride channel family protein
MQTLKLILLTITLSTLFIACGTNMDMDMGANYPQGNLGMSPQYETPPPANAGDNYEAPGTNAYVLAQSNPLSTFAADVDTASYDIFRRDILLGNLPHTDGVRLEEYVNFFAYGYEAPKHDAADPFAVSMEATANPFTEGTRLLRVGIKGRKAPPEIEKMGANLVFLVDVSGSMSWGHKLNLVQLVLTETLNVLKPNDTVALVTYAGSVGVRLKPTKVSEKSIIKDAINSLTSGGSTNGAGGIQLAYEQALAGFVDGGVNHVILCTDGDFNVGLSGTQALVKFIEEKRKTGITFTALGFGAGNLNDAMMEAISNAGNGVYGMIADEDQAFTYVHKRLLSNMHFIAKDVKIQVEFNPHQVHAYRLLGYENRVLTNEQFLDKTVDAGEIGAEHTVTALYELVMAGGEIPNPEGAPEVAAAELYDGPLSFTQNDLCKVRVRYKDVDATEDDESHEMEVTIEASTMSDAFDDAGADLQWAAAIAAWAEILKKSPFANTNNLSQIAEVIAANAGDDADRIEFKSLFETAQGFLASP